MGEVYRARDTKLNRDVAIKVLPHVFAADADRLVRFRREAQLLASLNHPNIAHVHGLEESGDTRALVMELVEGDDLAQRLARGPLTVSEALPIAKQIAEALEAAHDAGIIHRDLKPANIKVRDDGTVKVLDFGLAKALEPLSATAEALNSPTITAHGTELGVILGTAAYMSPEQAKGKPVDKRADIWAFGVVVYEMLSGQRLFKGGDASETIASVLKDAPSFDALPPGTPHRLTLLLRRCLDRDVRDRLRDIGEARVEIAKIQAGQPEIVGASAPVAASVSTAARILPWACAALLAISLLALLLIRPAWRQAPPTTPHRMLVNIGTDASLSPLLSGSTIALSPDGTTMAFTARKGDQTLLFVRRLAELQATALAGTEGASSPFFSPSGRWIAFFAANNKLKKVSAAGGAVVEVCDARLGRGGTFVDDETIIFAPSLESRFHWELMKVPAAGGTPQPFVALSEGAIDQRWPQALPNRRGVLYTEHSALTGFDHANIVVVSLSGDARPKVVLPGSYYGRYATSGHLVYVKQGTLFAIRFDLDRLETIGQAMPVFDDLISSSGTAGAQFAFSAEGSFVYVPGAAITGTYPIHWMTREGKTSTLRAEKADWTNPRFSPDGEKLALDISDGKQHDIFVYDLSTGSLRPLTAESADDRAPVWTPDGKSIVFSSDRDKRRVFNLYWMNADGSEVKRLTDSPDSQQAYSFSPGAKILAFQESRSSTRRDVMLMSFPGARVRGWTPESPRPFLTTPANETAPMFSPDGRWILYCSDGSGRREVWVKSVLGTGASWKVSSEGGDHALWSSAAHEILFADYEGRIMVARYSEVGEEFRPEKPEIWSPVGYRNIGVTTLGEAYDLHPDGKRLAIRAVDQNAIQDAFVLISNFSEFMKTIGRSR